MPSLCASALCALAWLLAPAHVEAQEGVHEHDGFMLRLTLGVGYGESSESSTFGDVKLSGAAGSFSIDIGGAVTDNLVLHGRFSDLVIVNPTVELDGMELGTAKDASLAFVLLGPGLTYYVMPANVYFSAVVGLADARVDNGSGTTGSTDAGIGFQGDVGVEWWVSDNWGLGVAGRVSYFSISEDPGGGLDTVTLTGLGFAVLFSATYQ
jgi:hypothetical protein